MLIGFVGVFSLREENFLLFRLPWYGVSFATTNLSIWHKRAQVLQHPRATHGNVCVCVSSQQHFDECQQPATFQCIRHGNALACKVTLATDAQITPEKLTLRSSNSAFAAFIATVQRSIDCRLPADGVLVLVLDTKP